MDRAPDVAIVHVMGEAPTLNIYRYDKGEVEEIPLNRLQIMTLMLEAAKVAHRLEARRDALVLPDLHKP